MRKHFTEMNPEEKQAVMGRVAAIAARRAFVDHAEERMQQKKVNARDIEIALRYGHVIEVHNESEELRCVVEHTFGRPKMRVCVVISLETGTVVTTWKNQVTDTHATLDKSQYGWNINLAALLQACGC